MKLTELLKEGLTLSGKVKLYHYTKEDSGDSFILDPKKGSKNKSYYSSNDYKLSSFPRVFYYIDLNKTEKQVVSPYLYVGEVDGSQILSLQKAVDEWNKNSDALKAKNENAWKVVKAFIGDGTPDWDKMFKVASRNFLGLFYDSGGLPIVNLFKQLKVTKYVKR